MDLRDLKVLVVGVGGLGCPASLALAEAGVGTLGLMDPDKVELSNLHRQILYADENMGRLKAEIAAGFLSDRFPGTRCVPIVDSFNVENAGKYLGQYDLVIDGLDRLEKKFILNDRCVAAGKPYVHAGVVKFEGQVLAIRPGVTACLRCLLPKIPPPFAMPTCREAGVLGAFSQAVGFLQAQQALELAKGVGPLRLWKLDFQGRAFRSIVPTRDPDCAACGKGKKKTEDTATVCAE